MGNAGGAGSYGMGWCLPHLDEAMLVDLQDRGLLESTLVVVVGEFGRTPTIIAGQFLGWQHWPSCWCAILAGGSIRGGKVYGESDKIGAYVKDRPDRPQDLTATIYHALGAPLDPRLGKDGVSRPLTTGQPILDLFAYGPRQSKARVVRREERAQGSGAPALPGAAHPPFAYFMPACYSSRPNHWTGRPA